MAEASALLRLVNREGLHARPSAKIVATATRFDADVLIRIGDQSANAKSIIEVMMLASPVGTEVELEAKGPEAEAAVLAVASLIRAGFGEEML